jgi:HD-like signal output (HDOD) protein/CheY-like chemotaxis protein
VSSGGYQRTLPSLSRGSWFLHLKRRSFSDELASEMKRILFVDDEPNVLEGLRGLLRKQRKQWEMNFVASGEQALAELVANPYDLIISDMRMPGMDGATLLRKVKEDYPHMVRIVLSGQAEQEISRRMVHVAHEFLSKPCENRELVQVIERACKLQALLEHPALRQAIGRIGPLPVKPGLYTRLILTLENMNSSPADAASLIEEDVATSTGVLQILNSGCFRLPQGVSDIRTAISYLGFETVKIVALSVEMRLPQASLAPCPGFDLRRTEEHSLLAARIGRRLVHDRVQAQDIFSATLLKDAGARVLMTRVPDLFRQIAEQARDSRRPIFSVELDVLGVSHAEIGAYLLAVWGLPYSIVEAIAHHHAPSGADCTGLDPVCGVHIATALAEEICPADGYKHVGSGIGLDLDLIDRLGLTDQLPGWRLVAQEEAKKSAGAR